MEEQKTTSRTERTKTMKVLREVADWSATIVFALVFAFLFRSFVCAQSEVRMGSMQNTLFEGQRVVEYKLGYYFSEPKRGDIVIFRRYDKQTDFFTTLRLNASDLVNRFSSTPAEDHLIKRVIGIPGDVIDIQDGTVYINGLKSDEPYVKGVTYPNGMALPMEVMEDKLFVMGDNREGSLDSREFGLVDMSQIEGEAVLRVWPLSKLGGIQ